MLFCFPSFVSSLSADLVQSTKSGVLILFCFQQILYKAPNLVFIEKPFRPSDGYGMMLQNVMLMRYARIETFLLYSDLYMYIYTFINKSQNLLLSMAMEKLPPLLVKKKSFRRSSTNLGFPSSGNEDHRLGSVSDSLHESLSFIAMLKACAKAKDLHQGSRIHGAIAHKDLLRKNPFLGSSLISMYAKCGALARSQLVFDQLRARDLVCWNALISGYAQQGRGQEALDRFERMQKEGFSPNSTTFTCALKACASIADLDRGRRIHEEINRKNLLGKNVILGTALVNMYAKCGALKKAEEVLEKLQARNVGSWNALIFVYAQHGHSEEALRCYELMRKDAIAPDSVTYICVLKACASARAIDKGKQVHEEIVRDRLLEEGDDTVALGTALVDMYAKCGELAMSRQVFDGLHVRDGICWDALITGYAQQGRGEEALDCYVKMQEEGFPPDPITFSCLLKACAATGDVERGKQIHDEIIKNNFLRDNVVLATALVDMYAKCGALGKARQLFDGLEVRDVACWTALIAGYAQQGHGEEAVNCFERMQKDGFMPDSPTFLCIFNACSHSGLVDKGEAFFMDMTQKYGITPGMDHYACMVGLYVRAGHFGKAAEVIKKIPSDDNMPLWLALLGACEQWGNVEVGRWAFDQALQSDGCNTTAYVLMSNTYITAGMKEDARKIEAMKDSYKT